MKHDKSYVELQAIRGGSEVGIQECRNCGTRFEYGELMKPLGGYPHPLICSNCGALHKITPISRWVLQH